MTIFDNSLALESVGPGLWRGRADPHYEAHNGMFGGWTAALCLNSVLRDPAAEGSVSAFTVNYLDRLPPESALTLRTARLGGGKSLSHWRCDVITGESGAIAASAMIVLANRRASDAYTEGAMPDVPPPDNFPRMHPDQNFGERMDMRWARGWPWHNRPDTRSLVWEREMSGRTLDTLQLALLSDLGVPRIFLIGAAPRPSATVTITTYFHASEAELAACGDDFVLADMTASRIAHSTFDSKNTLWSRAGALLATSEQLCWFR